VNDTSSEIPNAFCERLILAMKALNFSRAQLAASVGVDKSLVSRWLSGRVRPSSHNLARISNELSRLKPGFNMTVWDRPREDFESFFGLAAAHAESMALNGADSPPAAEPAAGAWEEPLVPAPPLPAPPNSIAVLPFENLSGDPLQDALCDGVSVEIANRLAGYPDMRVAGHKSAFFFKGKNEDLRSIGRKLGVRELLEGSIRCEGLRLRVSVQLVRVEDGFTLWSQSFDRKLTGILAIQAEIAEEISEKIRDRRVGPDSSAHWARRAREAQPQGH
jgi:TolB-like protein